MHAIARQTRALLSPILAMPASRGAPRVLPSPHASPCSAVGNGCRDPMSSRIDRLHLPHLRPRFVAGAALTGPASGSTFLRYAATYLKADSRCTWHAPATNSRPKRRIVNRSIWHEPAEDRRVSSGAATTADPTVATWDADRSRRIHHRFTSNRADRETVDTPCHRQNQAYRIEVGMNM